MMLILEILGIEFSTPNKSGCKILFDEIENIDLIRKASRCIYSYQQDLNFKTLQNIFAISYLVNIWSSLNLIVI